MFGGVIAPAKLPALRQLVDDFRPDLVVHPPVDVAAPLVAAEHGLASVAYGFGQVLDPQFVAALRDRVAPLWREAGMDPDPYAGIYRGRYLDPCPPSLQPSRDPGSGVGVAEPIRPEVPGDRDAVLPDWIASLGQRPVVYLSLGTVPLFNQPHTFVTLLAELAHDDVDLVVTVGAAQRSRHARNPAGERAHRTMAPTRAAAAPLRRGGVPRRFRHDTRRARLRPAARTRSPRR